MKIFYQWIFLWLGLCLYAQPSGSCTEGTTQLGSDGHLYGCVVNTWKKLSNNDPIPYPRDRAKGTTFYDGAWGHLLSNNGKIYQLKSPGFVPIGNIPDAPRHEYEKIFYSRANQHFYAGTYDEKWHQLDPYMVYKCDEIEVRRRIEIAPEPLKQYGIGNAYQTCENHEQLSKYWTGPDKPTPKPLGVKNWYCKGYHPETRKGGMYPSKWELTLEYRNCVLTELP